MAVAATPFRTVRADDDCGGAFVERGCGRSCLAINAAEFVKSAPKAAGKLTERPNWVKGAPYLVNYQRYGAPLELDIPGWSTRRNSSRGPRWSFASNYPRQAAFPAKYLLYNLFL